MDMTAGLRASVSFSLSCFQCMFATITSTPLASVTHCLGEAVCAKRGDTHCQQSNSSQPNTKALFASHTDTQTPFLPPSPWRDVAALLHEGSQWEPQRVKDAKLIGRLVSGAQLCRALLWFLCMPLIRAEATHLRQWRKNKDHRSFRGLWRKGRPVQKTADRCLIV